MANSSLMVRGLLIGSLVVIAIVSLNLWFWHGEHRAFNPMAIPPVQHHDPDTHSKIKRDNFTVEKLNNQVQVKQLREMIINESLPATEHTLTDDELDQQIHKLEQTLQQLSTGTN